MKVKMSKEDESVHANGKRKTAKARASVRDGNGRVIINKEGLQSWPETLRLRILEPLRLADEVAEDVDVKAKAQGGGLSGQAEALRMAIARGLVKYTESDELESKFMDYDRNLLVEDYRRTETRKPSQSSKGARHKRQKSYR